ncbi:MAG: two-component system sensor histidine kinase CreC [Myxococcales bacterium]|nr:two-component system sensor histidine kinase CreC [Myxococcales bacterium]
MGLRIKILLGLFLLCLGGGYAAYDWLFENIRPQFLRIMEDGMVEHAYMLARVVEKKLPPTKGPEAFQGSELAGVIEHLRRGLLRARIYEWEKQSLDTRVYLTDTKGIVRYDSVLPSELGKNYSRWNDVYRALRGLYGARSSEYIDEKGRRTDAMFVAFPLRREGQVFGTITLCRSKRSLVGWARRAQTKLFRGLVIGGVIVFLCAWLLTQAIMFPIFRLTQYARDVTQGRRIDPPPVGRDEIGELTQAFVEMKNSLLERQDLERFVTQLTHELKSPISAVQGAAELLEDEDMPPSTRKHFLDNISEQTRRLNDIVQRLLDLVALEQRERLDKNEKIGIKSLFEEICNRFMPQAQKREVRLHWSLQQDAPSEIFGDRFLISQALSNLVQNALHFTPAQGSIELYAEGALDGQVLFQVTDTGPGIPVYALPRVMERFYSLEHPDSGKKGTGLGLPFVRQVALLHGGEFLLHNQPEGGVRAEMWLSIQRITSQA